MKKKTDYIKKTYIIALLKSEYVMLEIFNNNDLFTNILLVVFGFSFLIQLFFYLAIYARSVKITPDLNRKKRKYPPVSVIICAKNEEKNLKKFLPLVLKQDYPAFEVVVVNDCSDDGTADILEDFKNKYPLLKVSTIKKDPVFNHGKKLAITIGIKAAENDWLVFTDADCYPQTDQWLKYMARNFSGNNEIILGIGLYKKYPALLNLLIRFEAAFTAMQYIGFARFGKPYMGVGRNLAYQKELFFKNKGFASHSNLESGDDDLFVSETATKNNVFVENHPDSFINSEPEKKWVDWYRQKRRHLTTANFYQQSIKLLLSTEFLSRILLNLSFFILLFRIISLKYILIVYIIGIIIKMIIFNIVFRRMKEKYLFLPSILFEPIFPVFYGFIHFANYTERKRNRWK